MVIGVLELSDDGKTLESVLDQSVKSVTIPNSVTNICVGAFSGCTSLKSILSATVYIDYITIDEKAFVGFNIDECTLYIPSGTRWAYRHHPGFGKFKNIEIEKKSRI